MSSQMCPHCQKSINAIVRCCPFCGGEVSRPVTQTQPTCPRCEIPLQHTHYRNRSLDMCGKCHGMWLDRPEFKYLTSERDVYRDDNIPEEFVKKPLEVEDGYLRCVRCDALMQRRHFRKISAVLIDECIDHGIWLDGGELEHIRTFVANGGLDESQDSDIRANSGKIQDVAGRVKELEFWNRTQNMWNFKYWMFQ